MTALTQLRDSRELLVNLTMREVRGKYKRTALGQLWSLINPLAMMLIFTAVFGLVLKIKIDPGSPSGLNIFALWLVCALLPWNFMNSAVSGGMGSLVGNANLIKKVYFPRDALVASTVLSCDVTFLVELAVLFAAVFVLIYLPVIELEEQHLSQLFPNFADYSKRVRSLWPSFHPQKSAARFRWPQYVRNQEYQALLGFLAGEAFLVAKAFFFRIP